MKFNMIVYLLNVSNVMYTMLIVLYVLSNLHISDEIFMPKADGEIDNGEMDEVEKELEEFKR